MDTGQTILLVILIVVAIGVVATAVLYADYAERRTKNRRRSEHKLSPRIIPPAPPPPPPPAIDFGESVTPARAGKIRWGDEQPPRKVSRTDRLDSKRFVRCPICRQSITAEDIERGRLTVCRNCQTQYHTDCLSYTNNVCQMCHQV